MKSVKRDVLDFHGFAKDTIIFIKRLVGEDIRKGRVPTFSRKNAYPSPSQLETLLNISYQASLLTEEGEFHMVCVMWLPPQNLPLPHGNDLSYLTTRFTNPKVCNKLTVAKLAPLCSLNGSFLLVHSTEEKHALEIWGLCDVRVPPEKGDLKDRLGIADHPYALGVIFYHPGMFDVKWNGRFISGWPSASETKYMDTDLGLFPEASSSWRVLAGAQNLQKDDHQQIFYTVIEIIVGKIVSFRKGGTLLFIRDEYLWRCKDGSNHSFSPRTVPKHLTECLDFSHAHLVTCSKGGCDYSDCSSSGSHCDTSAVSARLNEVLNQNMQNGNLRHHGSFRYHIQFIASWIANFTRVDGAVLLTDRLRLIGFGAKIDAPENRAVVAPDLERLLQHHGMRHKSATRWVAADGTKSSRLALVISQDGSACAMFWHRGIVTHSPIVYEEV